MAEKDDKVADNVAGKFYVDSECTDCGECREIAPEIFGANEEEGWAFVKKQPEGEEELEKANEAMESCPVESIGDDGE